MLFRSVRATGDIIALSPPLILEKAHIDEMIGRIAEVGEGVASGGWGFGPIFALE